MPSEDKLQAKRDEVESLREELAASESERLAVQEGQANQDTADQLDAEKARLAAQLKESQALVSRQHDGVKSTVPSRSASHKVSGEGN